MREVVHEQRLAFADTVDVDYIDIRLLADSQGAAIR